MPAKESFDIDGLMVFRGDLTAVDPDGNTVASVTTPDKYVPSLKEPLSGEQIGRYTKTTAYWREHSTYVPLKGDVIIYSDGGSITEGGVTVYVPKMKVGDGVTTVGNLLFTDSDNQGGSAGTLNTTNTTSQTPSSSESLGGNVNLHKVSKTGNYNDLLNKPDLDATLYESVTYSQLVTKISNSQLVKGKKYRITDYVTTTTQTNTSSAGHAFDLVVTAIDVNKLDCMAFALLHSGDTYFSTAGADLSKWQIWYDVNNDTTKYDWADTTNGKGVIYRMIDEFNNDCPYDFKNIMFKRKLTNGSLDNTSGTNTFVFTFNIYDNGTCEDASTKQTFYTTDVSSYKYTHDNVIKPCFVDNEEYHVAEKLTLNDNVFLNLNNNDYYGSVSNTLDVNCESNTFGTNCYSNTLKAYCTDNVIGDRCAANIFGVECYSNTIGTLSEHNTFGDNCHSNILSTNCYGNKFGNYCGDNFFGNECIGNLLVGSCGSNKFGNGCLNNIIGIACSCIVFKPTKDNSNENSYYRNIIVENRNSYIHLISTYSYNDEFLQNIYIAQGSGGTFSAYTEISTIERNLSYRTTVGRDSSGNIRIYNEDDPASGVTIYSGSTAPSSAIGVDGDIYIQEV